MKLGVRVSLPDVEERKGRGEGGHFWLGEQQCEGSKLEGAHVQGAASHL